MNLLNSLIDLIFPKICFSCDKRLVKNEKVLCNKCENSLEIITNVCDICGSILESENCNICQVNDFYFDKARSIYKFNDTVQKLIHELKYNDFKIIAKFFGRKVNNYFEKFSPFSKIDMIVPVPLHRTKKRSRGFNQSELLASAISDQINIKHIPKLLKRTKFTDSQTKLSRSERQNNVAEAFKVNAKFDVKGKNILVVDDVFTTGSTVNSISRLLREQDVGKIFIFTIARA